jgi:hypothetical protein
MSHPEVQNDSRSEVRKPVAIASMTQEKKLNDQPHLLTYTIDDGFAVVQGDIIIGQIRRDVLLKSLSGEVPEPQIRTWPAQEIAYYIQPNLPNPERVQAALAFFAGTNIRFVPFTNQEDAIVFEKGQGACKSYVGYIGGKQPIYLPDGCRDQEIAHEIMHALGFVHEQNRSDRDSYLNVNWNNIDPQYNINFEKFSNSLMVASGQAPFDFNSIMIYPSTMFSINNQSTMTSKIEGQTVAPAASLTAKDKDRINAIY